MHDKLRLIGVLTSCEHICQPTEPAMTSSVGPALDSGEVVSVREVDTMYLRPDLLRT